MSLSGTTTTGPPEVRSSFVAVIDEILRSPGLGRFLLLLEARGFLTLSTSSGVEAMVRLEIIYSLGIATRCQLTEDYFDIECAALGKWI